MQETFVTNPNNATMTRLSGLQRSAILLFLISVVGAVKHNPVTTRNQRHLKKSRLGTSSKKHKSSSMYKGKKSSKKSVSTMALDWNDGKPHLKREMFRTERLSTLSPSTSSCSRTLDQSDRSHVMYIRIFLSKRFGQRHEDNCSTSNLSAFRLCASGVANCATCNSADNPRPGISPHCGCSGTCPRRVASFCRTDTTRTGIHDEPPHIGGRNKYESIGGTSCS